MTKEWSIYQTILQLQYIRKLRCFYQVVVNGEAYQPSIASDNKKKAKSDAATAALQQMGLLEKDPNNPL